MSDTLYVETNTVVVKTAAEWATDTETYTERQFLFTSDEFYTNTTFPKYKKGDGSNTWDNLDYFEDVKAALNTHTADTNNPHNTTKAQVGLANADNTSDVNKPVSTAQAAAIALKQSTSEKGAANGYAPLDGAAKVPSAYLPSYVDDVVEVATYSALPGTGESGKIYVVIADESTGLSNVEYRWTGSMYVRIVASPGTTDNVPEGVTNLYHTSARVLATILAGLNTALTGVITDTDTVLTAMGRLQNQISLRELLANKSTDVNADQASNTKYPSVKAVYDWVVGLAWLTSQIWGAWLNGLTSKATPVDADYIGLMDSADTNKAKKLSWVNLKTTLSVLFSTKTETQNSADKYAVATGTDTYTATLSPAPTAYVTGQTFRVKIPNSNTVTSPTINFNGLGAKTIVGTGSMALPIGLLIPNGDYTFAYDGTNFVLEAGLMDRRDYSYFRKTGAATLERWYTSAISAFTPGTQSRVLDTLFAIPFVVSKTCTIDRIGAEITTGGGAGSLVRLGIYSTNNMLPDALVLDAGTIDGNSATFQSITINQQLAPGLYWLVLLGSATITYRSIPAANLPPVTGVPAALGAGAYSNSITRAFTYASLPNPFGTAGIAATAGAMPVISVRLSS